MKIDAKSLICRLCGGYNGQQRKHGGFVAVERPAAVAGVVRRNFRGALRFFCWPSTLWQPFNSRRGIHREESAAPPPGPMKKRIFFLSRILVLQTHQQLHMEIFSCRKNKKKREDATAARCASSPKSESACDSCKWSTNAPTRTHGSGVRKHETAMALGESAAFPCGSLHRQLSDVTLPHRRTHGQRTSVGPVFV